MRHRNVIGILGGVTVVAGLVMAFVVHPATPVATHTQPLTGASSTIAPQPSATPLASPAVAGAATMAPVAAASVTPRPAQPRATTTTTPVSLPTAKLALSINGAVTSYAVALTGDTDACTILKLAKNQGLLTSVTLDDAYRNTLHSAYVREINGFANNWTFKVNGASPKGCSLALVTKGDTVSWTYQ